MAKYGRTVNLSTTYHQILADAVRPQLEDLADTIQSDAKRLCPIDTGALELTIHVSVESNGDITGTAGSEEVDYASYVEYGTQATAKRPWTTPAQPYMRPAFYENRGEI